MEDPVWIDRLNHSKTMDIGALELALVYDLSTFGSSRFLLRVKANKHHLILKLKQNEGAWKEKYFFVIRDAIPNGDSLRKTWIKRVGFEFRI